MQRGARQFQLELLLLTKGAAKSLEAGRPVVVSDSFGHGQLRARAVLACSGRPAPSLLSRAVSEAMACDSAVTIQWNHGSQGELSRAPTG